MKQVKFLAIALGLIIASFSANAQKIGYVNIDALVYNLPEAQKVQADFQKWQEDSIGGTYTRLSQEYREKDSAYQKATGSVKQVLEKDLGELGQTLGNWNQIAQQASQQKQAQMFNPLYKKVFDAITAFSKEKGYTYVLQQDAILIAPDADNVSIPVAQRLGIKVNNQGTVTPGAGGATPTTTPPKR